MKSFIKELFEGRLHPAEMTRPKDKEYEALDKEIISELRYFTDMLPEPDKSRFLKLEDLKNYASSMNGVEHFSHGFKLGAILMIEILADDQLFFSDKPSRNSNA